MSDGPPLHQVDAFADAPFAGNPAAVCLLEGPAGAAWMQALAAEMNLSETAFVAPGADGDGFELRWFTPVEEVDLCGHATLASAHTLWETGCAGADDRIVFHTHSGRLGASRVADGIELDFPATPAAPAELEPGLAEVLGVVARWSGHNGQDWLVEVADPSEVLAAVPDMARLAGLTRRGVIVTAPGGRDGFDVTSRFFGPAVGIPEDPVTGSAHCTLGPFWAERLGTTRLVCHQASARGGVVRVEVRGERVALTGRAVTVLVGRLAQPAG